MQESKLYLVVNRAIGRFPGFLFLPMPLLCILLAAFGTSVGITLFLGLQIGAVMMLGMFISLTWLFVVGTDPIRFTYSLLPPPNWVKGRYTVHSVLEQNP